MSTSSYLNTLRKSDLTELAETSHLKDYINLKKAELAESLDDHLKLNATKYGNEPTLSDYYKRLNGPRSPVKSPIKRLSDKVGEMVKSDSDDTPAPPTTRKRRPKTPESDLDLSTAATNTVKKTIRDAHSVIQGETKLVPSPAVVTDVIERQSRRFRQSISHVVDESHIQQYVSDTRDYFSRAVIFNVAATLIEAYYLEERIVPWVKLVKLGPIAYLKSTPTQLSIPDIFTLLTSTFWSPVLLWFTATVLLPGAISYFANLALASKHSHATRQNSRHTPQDSFDPFVFNISKGVAAYLIFARGMHFRPYPIWSDLTVSLVELALPGGWFGLVLSSGIGAAISLYAAVLKR